MTKTMNNLVTEITSRRLRFGGEFVLDVMSNVINTLNVPFRDLITCQCQSLVINSCYYLTQLRAYFTSFVKQREKLNNERKRQKDSI